MVEILFLCTRRPELSHAAYLAHLRERHAPLALRHHGTLRGYAVNAVEESLPGAPPLDSINALAFDSLEDFASRLYDSPEGERLVTEDHARFLGGAAGYAGAWSVHRWAEDLGAHWLCALQRRPEVSRERFFELCDAELVPEILASQPAATRVALLRVAEKLFPAAAPDWDAFLALGFSDAARAPLHPFASADCSVMLRRTVVSLCAATAPWRVREQVLRRPG